MISMLYLITFCIVVDLYIYIYIYVCIHIYMFWSFEAKMTKIRVLSSDKVAQSVERLHDNQKPWVGVLENFRFFICSASFFNPMLPWRSVGISNFDRRLHNLMMLIR